MKIVKILTTGSIKDFFSLIPSIMKIFIFLQNCVKLVVKISLRNSKFCRNYLIFVGRFFFNLPLPYLLKLTIKMEDSAFVIKLK